MTDYKWFFLKTIISSCYIVLLEKIFQRKIDNPKILINNQLRSFLTS